MRVRWAAAWGLLAGSSFASVALYGKILLNEPDLLGLDATAYVQGARRLLETGSPYSDALRAGPIIHAAENVSIAYLYPPPLAQAFVVGLWLPDALAIGIWLVTQAVAFILVVGLLIRRSFPDARLADHARAALLVIAFTPVIWALVVGNVSGWVAVVIGLALAASRGPGAFAVSVAAWLKITPGPLLLGALADTRYRSWGILAFLVIPAASVSLAPDAWLDFITLLPNLIGAPAADTFHNLAPSAVLGDVGMGPASGPLAAALLVTFLTLTVLGGTRGSSLAWVAAGTGAYLAATPTTWNHYLIALVPIGIAAWANAPFLLRAAILGTAVWYGPLWILGETSVHRLIGLTLWSATLIWIAVREALRPQQSLEAPAEANSH